MIGFALGVASVGTVSAEPNKEPAQSLRVKSLEVVDDEGNTFCTIGEIGDGPALV